MSSKRSIVWEDHSSHRKASSPSTIHKDSSFDDDNHGGHGKPMFTNHTKRSVTGEHSCSSNPFEKLLAMVEDTPSSGATHVQTGPKPRLSAINTSCNTNNLDASTSQLITIRNTSWRKDVDHTVASVVETDLPPHKNRKRRFHNSNQTSIAPSTRPQNSVLLERSRQMMSPQTLKVPASKKQLNMAGSIVGTRPSHWITEAKQDTTSTTTRKSLQDRSLQMGSVFPAQSPSNLLSRNITASHVGTAHTSMAPSFLTNNATTTDTIMDEAAETTTLVLESTGSPVTLSPTKKSQGILARQLHQVRDQERTDRLRMHSGQFNPINDPRHDKNKLSVELMDDGVEHMSLYHKGGRLYRARSLHDPNMTWRVDFLPETVRHHQLGKGSIINLYGSVCISPSISSENCAIVICTQLCERDDMT